jgi:hypothetical protein
MRQFKKNYTTFYPKLLPSSQKYGFGIPDPGVKKAVGSRIRNTGHTFKHSQQSLLATCMGMGTDESPKRGLGLDNSFRRQILSFPHTVPVTIFLNGKWLHQEKSEGVGTVPYSNTEI